MSIALRDTVKGRLRPCSRREGRLHLRRAKTQSGEEAPRVSLHRERAHGETETPTNSLSRQRESQNHAHLKKCRAQLTHERRSERSWRSVASALRKAGAERPAAGPHAPEIRSFKQDRKTGLLQHIFKAGYLAPETL